jgi:alpha-D-xyloside xylohydrolase
MSNDANRPAKKTVRRENGVVTRREILALAGAAPAMLVSTRADAQPQPQAQPELEQHEFVQAISSFEKNNSGVVFHCLTSTGKTVDITFTVCTPEILRVQMCPDPELKNVKGLLEIKQDWAATSLTVTEKPESISLDTGSLRIEFQKKPWKYAVYDKQGQIVVQEHIKDTDTQGNFRGLPIGFTTVGGKVHKSNETFALAQDENFYGLGERFTKLNKLGLRVDGWQANGWGAGTDDCYKEIPFVMSTGGYGIFANTTFRTRWDMGSRSVVSYTFLIDDPRLDYFIIYGPSLKQILARYDEITGWPAFPPKKSFGIWFKVPGRTTGDGSPMAMAKKFRDMDLPMDFFTHVVSIRTMNQQDELVLTRQLSAELGKMGIEIGMYVSPFMEMDWEIAQEARAKGYVLTKEDGSPYEAILAGAPSKPVKVEHSLEAIERDDEWRDRYYKANRVPLLLPDFTNPAVFQWWKEKVGSYVKAGCFGSGMSDFGEDIPVDAHYHNKRSGLEMHNMYQMLYQKATFEGIAENSDRRPLINARSGTAGMQKYPICWSGDPECEWDEMASTLRAGLSIGLSGVPFWSNDIAGYQNFGGLTTELYIRWMQMDLFQSHTRFNGLPLRAPWAFGDRAVENYRKYAKLRYRLLPYIYSHAYNATKAGLPMIRAMVLDFQDDPSTHNLQDQYMFGDALLVAPVYRPVSKRTVYLPAGTWYDYETGKEYTGPNTLRIEPPLDVLPLYVKENSIIPMGPNIAYIGEKPTNPITLDTWLSSEAECTLYDDDERARTQEIVKCRASKKENQITLNVGASTKTFIARFNKTSRPKHVTLNGKDMPHLNSLQEIEKAELGWYFDPSSVVYAKFSSSESAKELVLRW